MEKTMHKLGQTANDVHRYELEETEKNIRKLFLDFCKEVSKGILPGTELMFSMSEKYSEYKKRRFVLNCEKFVRSLAVPDEKIEGFLRSLSSEQQKWLVTFVLDALYEDDEEKCQIYGYLFRDLVRTKDIATYRRLIRSVKSTFIEDLATLGQYKDGYVDSSEIGQLLSNVGLVKEVRYSVGVFGGGDPEEKSVKYKLTDLGKRLLKILEINKWAL